MRTPGLRAALTIGSATTLTATVLAALPSPADTTVDIVRYFETARDDGRDGLARKTKTVDVRPAEPGEVVVTVIAGEGRETQSPPAKDGDMVVRNRCPETGNEEILVPAANFSRRYEGPTGPATADGWRPYRPRGVEMRYIILTDDDGALRFTAPWGEAMIARPGDAIVQDVTNETDTYRIQKDAFTCTYEVIRAPRP